MLKQLQIQNYVLIDSLEINFSNGLSIITGETGAGKSILLGALSLILGKRADPTVLSDKNNKCIIEAEFNIKNYPLQPFFDLNDLDFEENTSLRREIRPNGKSRAFINDTPVSLTQLKQLGEFLISIHSQHQNPQLNTAVFQTHLVDAYAKNSTILSSYAQQFKRYKFKSKELATFVENNEKSKSDLDYFKFQYDELIALNLQIDEQEGIEEEVNLLSNSEEIKMVLSSAAEGLNSEVGVVSVLNNLSSSLNQINSYGKEINELAERLKSSLIDLGDIASEIENTNESLEFDPLKLELLNERLSEIYRLQKKHGLNSIPELITLTSDLSDKIVAIDSFDELIAKKQLEIEKIKLELTSIGNKLSSNRKKAIPKIEKIINADLAQLGMPNAELKIELNLLEEPSNSGLDAIDFSFKSNKGSAFEKLSKVASGGELSRLMLAIKSVLAKSESLPTVIFDEIDTGISGEIADRVGEAMKQLANTMQVIAITHLPQVAGKGKHHFKVAKEDNKKTTKTNISLLSNEGRIVEIAKMISGVQLTDSALENAKNLLSCN